MLQPDRASWDCPFVINGRFYTQSVTGVQRYAREITLALDAILARTKGRGTVLTPAQTSDVPSLQAIAVAPVGGRLTGQAWEQLALPGRARRPILSLCNTGPLLAGSQIVCLHDANVFTTPESYSASFRLFYKSLHPLLARRASRLTSVSKASRDQLARVLPVRAPIEVVPNGHEHAFRWTAANSRLASLLTDGRPFVLLLGSRAKHKNAALVLQQAEALEALGVGLVVAGGSSGIFEQTSSVAQRNVLRLGVVSDDDLAWLYGRALCLAFPSRTEGFGLPIVEAMALGCPVVSSDQASMPEVCGSAALLASPDDPQAWQAHFEALVRSPSLRDDLRARGREQVRHFSWTASAQHYLDLFTQVA